MSTPAEVIAKELRSEAEARLSTYKAELRQLQGAAARIAELQALIAYLETDTDTIPIARRAQPVADPLADPVAEPTRTR